MKIAYRRMSGAIWVSPKEKGKRGLWYEKRIALINVLTKRGHQVDFTSRLTAESDLIVQKHDLKREHELLFVEFGSSNTQFYGKDLEETNKQINDHLGPVIFLNDDPDLPMIWEMVKKPKQWSCWYNACAVKSLGKQPIGVPSYDMPFSAFQTFHEPMHSGYQNQYLVYIGRPLGRSTAVKKLIAGNAPWRVFGKQKEWEEFGVIVADAPEQTEREGFYRAQLGSLVLADKKHKEMGWRTGRAYHAIAAGCPAMVESDHKHLRAFPMFSSMADIQKCFYRWRDPDQRIMEWQKTLEILLWDKQIAEKTLVAHGL